MELWKDYDYTIYYRPGWENVIVDVLSRKSFMLGVLVAHLWTLTEEFTKLALKIEPSGNSGVVAQMWLQVDVWEEIKQATTQNGSLKQWVDKNE